MTPKILETDIAERLRLAYQPGVIASTDGFADMYSGVKMNCAAVLIPLIFWKSQWHLVFTHRTEVVEHHKGQVSFPGGGCELDESSPEQTALREAAEEIGIKPGDVRVLGRMNDVLTITHYRVTPVVGVMPWPYDIHPEPAEVERIFTIPLLWLADPDNWSEQMITPTGKTRSFPVISYHPYEGEVLWGASARMTQNFLLVIGLLQKNQ